MSWTLVHWKLLGVGLMKVLPLYLRESYKFWNMRLELIIFKEFFLLASPIFKAPNVPFTLILSYNSLFYEYIYIYMTVSLPLLSPYYMSILFFKRCPVQRMFRYLLGWLSSAWQPMESHVGRWPTFNIAVNSWVNSVLKSIDFFVTVSNYNLRMCFAK